MREPLGEWADQEIVIEEEEIIPVEDEIDIPPYPVEEAKKEKPKEDIYDEKPEKPSRPGGYW